MKTQFTENERAILIGSRDNEFDDALEGGCPWVFAVIATSELDPTVARGSLSSLVQKGVIEISDYEGRGDPDDQVLSYTPVGLESARHELGYPTDSGLQERLADE